GEREMSTKEAVKELQEYASVPIAELVESSSNPRKTFDEERLEELAESIRSKGILSPLLARRVNGHFEIVSGARRYRAAQRARMRLRWPACSPTISAVPWPNASRIIGQQRLFRKTRRPRLSLCGNSGSGLSGKSIWT